MTSDRTNIIGKIFLLTVLLSGILQASVFNDAAFWVREFRDADADGMIENANDVADARNINGESTVTLYGTPEGRIVSIEDIVNPYTGKTIVAAPCCYFPQSIYVLPKDNTTIVGDFSSFGVLEGNGGRISVTNGTHTCMLRIKPDWTLHPDAQGRCMWMMGGIGFNLGLELQNDGRLQVVASYGKKNAESYKEINGGVYIHTNVWSDVVTVMDGSSVVFYAITNGGSFQVSRQEVDPSEAVYTDFYLGNWQKTTTGTAKNSYIRSFRGRISQVALWNRELSEREVRSALAFPSIDVFRVGVENGSSGEFGKDTIGADNVNVDVWSAAPSAISGGKTVSYAFNADALAASLPQALRLTAQPDSAFGALGVAVNGVKMADLNVTPGLTTSVLVPANTLVAGENIVSLSNGTDGSVLIDALALGGSVQIGNSDDSYEGFVHIDSVYSFADISGYWNEWKNVSRSLVPERTNEIRVTVSEYAARRHKWLFEADLWSRGTPVSDVDYGVTLLVNGKNMGRYFFDTGNRDKVFGAEIPAGMLRPGENSFAVVGYVSENRVEHRYMYVDCYRLSVLEAPVGFQFIVR